MALILVTLSRIEKEAECERSNIVWQAVSFRLPFATPPEWNGQYI